MKPRKQIKPHDFVKKEFTWLTNWTMEYRNHTQSELIRRINEASAQIHQRTLRGNGDFVVFGGDVANRVDEIMRDDLMNDITFGEGTVSEDGTTLTQEVIVDSSWTSSASSGMTF